MEEVRIVSVFNPCPIHPKYTYCIKIEVIFEQADRLYIYSRCGKEPLEDYNKIIDYIKKICGDECRFVAKDMEWGSSEIWCARRGRETIVLVPDHVAGKITRFLRNCLGYEVRVVG